MLRPVAGGSMVLELRRGRPGFVVTGLASSGGMASLEGKRAIVTGALERDRRGDRAGARRGGRPGLTGSRRDGNLDVTDTESTQRFVDAALAELGGLDILVNNAGLSRGRDPVWESLEEDEREVIETNVLGLMRMTRLCLPHLIESGHGHIVNMGSVAGIWAYPSGSSYVASKFAVHGYTRALRDDLQGKPVRVTNVAARDRRDRFLQGAVQGRRGEGQRGLLERGDGRSAERGGHRRVHDLRVTRRPNVNIDEILVMALAQVSGGNILRET